MEDTFQTVSISGSFRLDLLHKDKSLLMIPVPDKLVMLVGRVALQWGGFEARMNQLIKVTLAGYSREIPGWESLPFKKRKQLFRDLMVEYSTAHCPQETETLREIVASAAGLHWKRNTVVHGPVAYNSEPDPTSETGHRAVFTANGIHNGKPVSIPLDEETLERLWHDLAHLGGALMQAVIRMGGTIQGPELLVEDRQFLQSPLSGSFQTVPIPRVPRLWLRPYLWTVALKTHTGSP